MDHSGHYFCSCGEVYQGINVHEYSFRSTFIYDLHEVLTGANSVSRLKLLFSYIMPNIVQDLGERQVKIQ